jgi:hypothetical protein
MPKLGRAPQGARLFLFGFCVSGIGAAQDVRRRARHSARGRRRNDDDLNMALVAKSQQPGDTQKKPSNVTHCLFPYPYIVAALVCAKENEGLALQKQTARTLNAFNRKRFRGGRL